MTGSSSSDSNDTVASDLRALSLTEDRDNRSRVGVQQCFEPKYLYIQLELCKKETLGDWLIDKTENDCKEKFTVQILNAVKHIHAQGLIHRDLKV